MKRPVVRSLLVALVACATVAQAAQAATVRKTTSGCKPKCTAVRISGGPQAESFSVAVSNGAVTIRESGPGSLSAGAGCRRSGRSAVRCALSSRRGLKLNAVLGGGSDSLTIRGSRRFIDVYTVAGGAGNDRVRIDVNAQICVQAGAGDDRVSVFADFGRACGVEGGDGNDILLGDTVDGGPGNDRIEGDGSDGTFDGGSGNDTITGDGEADSLDGGPGNDVLNGGGGEDRIVGDVGNDRLLGGAGDDFLTGNAGVDTFDGGSGDDEVSAEDAEKGGDGGAQDSDSRREFAGEANVPRENVSCGTGKDAVTSVDRADVIGPSCEAVQVLDEAGRVRTAPVIGPETVSVQVSCPSAFQEARVTLSVPGTVSDEAARGNYGTAPVPSPCPSPTVDVAVPLTADGKARLEAGTLQVIVDHVFPPAPGGLRGEYGGYGLFLSR